jgi:GDP-L-fucose synthase
MSIRTELGRIWVAGHTGMVGSALYKRLKPCHDLVVCRRGEVDLTRQIETEEWLKKNRPTTIFLCAARVGGIYANATYPAEFIYENLAIQTNVIDASKKFGVRNLIFLGSSCTYPKSAPQPISEDQLMQAEPEITNIWYAVAKIAGIKMVEAYRRQYGLNYKTIMPANCYGPGDNFHPTSSHVIPAMINKIHSAKINNRNFVEFWGTGSALREFIYVDDLADGIIYLSTRQNTPQIINLGSGQECSIRDLAIQIAEVIGYGGEIRFDSTMPDGAPRKVLDTTLAHNTGWKASTSLREGLMKTYEWYRSAKPCF